MAVSRSKTWSAGEALTASDLNAEFNNILNNGDYIGWPATRAKDMDAFELILDGDADTSIAANTDDRIDFKIGGADGIHFGHASGNTGAFVHIDPGAKSVTASTDFGRLRVGNTNAITVPAGTTAVAASLYLEEPNLTATGTVTDAAALYIEAAPSEGTNNYALLIAAGNSLFGGKIDVNGNELILDADADTSITADSDDRIDIRIGGTDEILLGLDSTNSSGIVTLDSRAVSASANTNVARLQVSASNALTIPAGTTAIAAGLRVDEPNFTATGTITSAATLYIPAAPTEGGTNNYALWIGAGESRFDGKVSMVDQILNRPVLENYGETVNAIGATGGGTQDIDLTLGNVVTATVDTSANTFTFSNPPASGVSGSFTLYLTNGGSQTVNWPASVDWPAGVAPTLTSSGVDILVFSTTDGGTIWHGGFRLDSK